MANYGELDAGVVVNAIVAGAEFIATLPNAADWIELPYGVGVGWTWNGSVWTGPNGESPLPEPVEPGNYILSGGEWVERFTDAEWAWLKTQRETTARLDQMMDAIRWTDSINIKPGGNMDEFYAWLLSNGLPGGQARIDELRLPK